MADPREDLVDPILGNEPGLLPPEPLRLTVRPRGVEAPPITDVGWGSPTGVEGRPSGRLFEPDQSAPRQPTYGERLGLPYIDQQGGSGALGGLVKGVRDWFTAPPAVADLKGAISNPPPRDATALPREMWRGSYSSATPTMENQPAPVRGLNWGVNELNDYVGGAVEAGRVVNDPGATPRQVDEARQQEARKTAGLTGNLLGTGVTAASIRGGASAGVFGGRIEPARIAFAERLEKEGVKPQEIWKQTGIGRFADKQWRQEIPDLAASYRGGVDDIASRIFDQQNPTRQGKYNPRLLDYGSIAAKQDAQFKIQQGKLVLEDVIPHHPELYALYPELRRMPVSHDAMMEASGGYYARHAKTPEGKIVYREEVDPSGKVEPRGLTFQTLIHEIDHAIANIEGFAKGGNASATNVDIAGSPARRFYDTIVKQFPPGTMTPAQIKEARERAASTAYWASAGENAAKVAEQRINMTRQQRKDVFPEDQMPLKFSGQNVEYNVPYNANAPQASLGGLVKPMELPEFKPVRGPEPSEPGYVYHATSWENAQDIAGSGKLNTHKAHEFTDQRTWPDGATEKRNYFTPNAENTWQFAPEEGTPVLLRMKQAAHPIKREGTGDLYSTKPVKAEHLEYLGADNKWYPVKPKVDPAPEMQASMPLLRGKAADEAWRGVEREPKLNTTTHPFSNVGGTPISTMDSPIIKGSKIINPRTIDFEKDLANAELIFGAGDATGAGGRLHGSKNLPFEEPVGRHGGPGYASNMLDKPIEGHPGASPVWASMKGPMGEILNIARDVESRGKVPWLTYMTGGKQYLDSSMQMVDTALQAAKSKGVSSTANEHLVKVMHSDWNTAANSKLPFPETGLKDEVALRAWIEASPQPQRAKLVKAMDTKEARSLGFPNIGELRVWNTDPRMITAPPGSAGLTMSRLYPSAGTVKSHHPAYDTAVAGTDVRTLGMQVPHEIIAPTMHASRMATLKKPEYYQRAPHLYFPGGGTHATKTEPVTNEMKDRLQEWMRKHPGGLAVAGAAGAGAAGMGSLVDPSRYEAR